VSAPELPGTLAETGAPAQPGGDSSVKPAFTPKQLQRIIDRQAKTIEKLRATISNRPKRRRREVETMDYVKAAERFIKSAGTRVGEGDEHELRALLSLQAIFDGAVQEAVNGQRQFGKSWAAIGLAAGTSKEAAWQRWGKGQP
jgi:molybdopterin converting factor small subunit